MKWNERIKKWDLLVRHGQGLEVRIDLETSRRKPPPRECYAAYAAICRRVDLSEFALKLLHPVVRSSRKTPQTASPREVVEYAANLVRVGAGEEALVLLNQVSQAQCPEVLLFRSHALASCWDYAQMIPLLEAYLAMEGVEEYTKLIAKVNLAAAYVWQAPGKVPAELLSQILKYTEEHKLHLLHGNALELMAQNALAENQLPDARRWLNKAEKFLKGTGVRDAFFVRKWSAVIDLKASGLTDSVRRKLHEVRKEAQRIGHWETLRQCDLFEAESLKDRRRMQRLYFGTPYNSFRARVLALWKPEQIPPTYTWEVGPEGTGSLLDLSSGILSQGGTSLKKGRTLHQTLSALASDFYRPLTVAKLFLRLYPDEFYHPDTSPQRVYFALKELRSWLEKVKTPLKVLNKGDGYYLSSEEPLQILLPQSQRKISWEYPLYDRLKDQWGTGVFSAKEAERHLGLSARSTLRLLVRAMELGKLKRLGEGAATRYHFKGD